MILRQNRSTDFNKIWYDDTLILEEGQATTYHDAAVKSSLRFSTLATLMGPLSLNTIGYPITLLDANMAYSCIDTRDRKLRHR